MDSPTGLENSNDSFGYPQNSNSFAEISTDHNSSSSSPETPKSDRIPVALSFGSGNSDVTPNHDSDSSYSELDSEAEAFYSTFNHHLVSPGTMESHDSAEKQMSYGELMKRFVECEEELRITNLKLQDSEQEIEKLKGETEKKDLLAENLRVEIETAQREIETENRRVLELQGQVVDLETKLSESSFKIENLVNELEVSRECLHVSDAEISKLREMFSTEKTNLEADIVDLLEKQTFLEAQIKEIESHGEVLEDQIRHFDAEKIEMQRREIQLQDEINALKKDLASRTEHTEVLNKEFDKHKLRYDMLMAEKDGVFAELDNLKAELRSRDIEIEQMEELKVGFDMLMAEKDGVFSELDNLKAEMRSRDIEVKELEEELNEMRDKQTELLTESGNAKNTVEELRAMVQELEKQAELQRTAITEGEEEKREAIRQLCFTLDHYKSGYRELLRFLSNNNSNKQQQAIMVV